MPLIQRYALYDEGEPWYEDAYFYHPNRIDYHPGPSHAEISVPDYMGIDWTSAAHILQYLLNQPALRQRIIEQITHLSATKKWQGFAITHPLLKLPLLLKEYASDEDFQKEMRAYLQMNRVYYWTR